MAGQGPDNTHNAGKFPGQPQMMREWDDQPSDQQNTNFLQETGTHVKTMAQGAADVGMGAAQGAFSLARGVAAGAANMAQGTAEVVKNTLGVNNPGTGAATGSAPPSNTHVDMNGMTTGNTINMDQFSTNTSHPSNHK